MRDLQLVFLDTGGLELWDIETQKTIWSSDSDDEFREEFPEIVDVDNAADVEMVIDYLEDNEVVTTREAEILEVMGPGDDEDDEDEDDEEDLADWERDELEEEEVSE